MAFTEDRFSLSADRYLARHNVLVYLEDAIAQLLEHREENSKINPLKFLSEYFCSLRDGNHTIFREYIFIRCTPHNRASFVKLFLKCFRQIGKKGDLLSIHEYHSLLGLLCPDFPFTLVQKTARIILIDDALDCLISFVDFIYAFQVQFYYEEFLEKSAEIYQSILQTQRSPRDPVVVPSASTDTNVHQSSHHPADGIDAVQFFRALYPLCDQVTFKTPPINALKDILFAVPRISFYGFLMAIAKSEAINEHIGYLPPRAELLDGKDGEITSIAAKIIHVPPPKLTSSKTRQPGAIPAPDLLPAPAAPSAAPAAQPAGSKPRHASSRTMAHTARKRSAAEVSELSQESSSESESSESSDTN